MTQKANITKRSSKENSEKSVSTPTLFQIGLITSALSLVIAFLVGWLVSGLLAKVVAILVVVNTPLVLMWLPYMQRDTKGLLDCKNISLVGVILYSAALACLFGLGHWIRSYQLTSNFSNLLFTGCCLMYLIGLMMYISKLRKA